VKWIEIPLGNELTDNILDDTSTVIPETWGTKACPESLESKVEDEWMLSFRSSDTRRAIGYSWSLDSSLRSEWQIDSLFQDQELPVEQQSQVTEFITLLLWFARSHWLTYLEVNPFVIQDGKVCCLDMVAKVDTCEAWKQWENRMNLKFVKPFGSESHPLEQAIEALDAETWASLKFSIMNPQWKIGLLLGWGWASVIVMDKLADMGMMNEVVNYWELSWNPSYGDNKAYIEWVVQLMLENNHSKQYLCLMGWIANFTKIDVLAQAYIDALHPNIQNIKDKNIHCIIRRGWPGDTKWLEKIWNFLADYAIPHTIADGDEYLTTVLESIQFSANS
jgi:succinyl-CoA synthetase beta subunit